MSATHAACYVCCGQVLFRTISATCGHDLTGHSVPCAPHLGMQPAPQRSPTNPRVTLRSAPGDAVSPTICGLSRSTLQGVVAPLLCLLPPHNLTSHPIT
jgi:hypothetical protein